MQQNRREFLRKSAMAAVGITVLALPVPVSSPRTCVTQAELWAIEQSVCLWARGEVFHPQHWVEPTPASQSLWWNVIDGHGRRSPSLTLADRRLGYRLACARCATPADYATWERSLSRAEFEVFVASVFDLHKWIMSHGERIGGGAESAILQGHRVELHRMIAQGILQHDATA